MMPCSHSGFKFSCRDIHLLKFLSVHSSLLAFPAFTGKRCCEASCCENFLQAPCMPSNPMRPSARRGRLRQIPLVAGSLWALPQLRQRALDTRPRESSAATRPSPPGPTSLPAPQSAILTFQTCPCIGASTIWEVEECAGLIFRGMKSEFRWTCELPCSGRPGLSAVLAICFSIYEVRAISGLLRHLAPSFSLPAEQGR